MVKNAALILKDSIFTTPLWSWWLLQEIQLRHQGKVFVFASVSDSEEELGRKIQVCLFLASLRLEFGWVLLSAAGPALTGQHKGRKPVSIQKK